jgi:hypothetical protein
MKEECVSDLVSKIDKHVDSGEMDTFSGYFIKRYIRAFAERNKVKPILCVGPFFKPDDLILYSSLDRKIVDFISISGAFHCMRQTLKRIVDLDTSGSVESRSYVSFVMTRSKAVFLSELLVELFNPDLISDTEYAHTQALLSKVKFCKGYAGGTGVHEGVVVALGKSLPFTQDVMYKLAFANYAQLTREGHLAYTELLKSVYPAYEDDSKSSFYTDILMNLTEPTVLVSYQAAESGKRLIIVKVSDLK